MQSTSDIELSRLAYTSETAAETASPPNATLGGITPILRVANLDASIAYYLDQLGFHLQWRTGPVASLARDRAALMLCEGDQGHTGTWVWISAQDVDMLYTELGRRKARLRHPPTNYPWGSRECQVTDLDGHVLRFGSDLRPGEPMGEWRDGEGRVWLPQPDGGWRTPE
jgi:catechol 2,3-dioxygenase-like lactoylglutathione lyase family enzyme